MKRLLYRLSPFLLMLILLFMASITGSWAADSDYNTKVYIQQGGDILVIKNGGYIILRNGAQITLESGAVIVGDIALTGDLTMTGDVDITGGLTVSEESTFDTDLNIGEVKYPSTKGTATYVLALKGDDSGELEFVVNTGTFTGGNITGDITFNANNIDILPKTDNAFTYSIQTYDVNGTVYKDVLRWTNGDVPAVVLNDANNSLVIASTKFNVDILGAVTGVTDLTMSGALTGATDITASGTLTAGAWSIGTFTTTGATTLGNNTSTFAVASTGIDINAAGAVSNVTTLEMSGDLTNSAGDIILANGKGIKGSQTGTQTVGLYGYDTNKPGFVGAVVITNGDTPATVLGNTDGTTAISSSDWTINTAGNMANIGSIAADGLITFTNDTDASDISTASVVLTGGLAVTKKSFFGTEATFLNNAAAATFGNVLTNADVVLAFDAVTAQGSITYMEDEDRFDFDNDVDVVGAFTAGSVASDAAVSGTTITASTGFALGDGDYIGVTGNEIITFNTAGTIKVQGADFYVGGAVANEVRPSFMIVGDADSDAVAVSETLTVALTANATPTNATWDITSTQSAGYSFDKNVTVPSLAISGAISTVDSIAFDSASVIYHATVELSNSDIKNLNATPKVLVAAPGTNKVIELVSAVLILDYTDGTALTESADNLVIQYTTSGVDLTDTIESGGFIDQTADTLQIVTAKSGVIVSAANSVHKSIELFNSGDGEFGGNDTNNTTMTVKVAYRIHADGL